MIGQNALGTSIGGHKVRPPASACAWISFVHDVEIVSIHHTSLLCQQAEFSIYEDARREPERFGLHIVVTKEVILARGLFGVFFQVHEPIRMTPCNSSRQAGIQRLAAGESVRAVLGAEVGT